ncbi:hypothetical protein BKA67DRAFT_537943 [Truncatella angustata]|uniref:Uncharacterized protein n=1 Tax=Truncatella angustata TaxID=152316 RepID=A0A9P8UGV9_9PEZI|nr:uncharacterized protein BKA67DRAFT_537943 [Truncatella angustata]KAH6652102.1 hypothetical protein BKA67DRAFT_537943 [Truncatella angustata]
MSTKLPGSNPSPLAHYVLHPTQRPQGHFMINVKKSQHGFSQQRWPNSGFDARDAMCRLWKQSQCPTWAAPVQLSVNVPAQFTVEQSTQVTELLGCFSVSESSSGQEQYRVNANVSHIYTIFLPRGEPELLVSSNTSTDQVILFLIDSLKARLAHPDRDKTHRSHMLLELLFRAEASAPVQCCSQRW